MNNFFDAIEKYNLTPSEKLLILNHCPESAVEIQLLIEDSEERLSEEQVDLILQEVKVHLIGENEQDDDDKIKPEVQEQEPDN